MDEDDNDDIAEIRNALTEIEVNVNLLINRRW
jgi:hypothetical protein